MSKFINPPIGSPIPIPLYRLPNGGVRQLISMDGLELVKDFEGCALESYFDSVNVSTIGFGRIIYPNGRKVRPGDTCTLAQCFEWLFQDLQQEGAQYVAKFTKKPYALTECQWSALVSFTYNRGAGRFHEKLAGFVDKSLLDEHIDHDELRLVSNTMLEYDWAGSGANRKKLLGLKRRRLAEREMFMGGDWHKFVGPAWAIHTPIAMAGNALSRLLA